MIYLGQYLPAINYKSALEAGALKQGDVMHLKSQLLQLNVLAGGFIVTSLIWASATAKIIDRRFFSASIYFAVGGILVLFGFIHSPLIGDRMFLPWQMSDPKVFDAGLKRIVLEFAVAYLVMSMLMFAIGTTITEKPIDSDEEFQQLGG